MAQTSVLDDVHTVATTQTGVPVEHDFQVFTAGTYAVTLTDIGASAVSPATPSPLASLKLALTTNDALVGAPLVVAGVGIANSGSGTLNFTASSSSYPVTYRIHVIGAPASGHGPGPINIQVTNTSTNTTVSSWNDVIGLPAQGLPATEALLQDSFTVATAGSYLVALSDLGLPHSLGTLTMILVQTGTNNFYILPNPNNPNPLQQTISLAPGTYQIYAVGQVASGATGGLFSVTVTGGGGASLYAMAVPVGTTVLLGNPVLAAGSYTLTVNDLRFPAPLAQAGVALTSNGLPVTLTTAAQPATTVAAGQSGTFTATTGGTFAVYGNATPTTAAPGAGSYAAQITSQSSAAAFSVAQVVTTPGGPASAYSLGVTISSAGSYSAALTDFQIPAPLSVADFAVVQNGMIVGTPLSAPGTLAVSLAAAPATLLAVAEGGTGGSTFDLDLTNSGGQVVADQPQGVGVTFATTKVSITTAGTYDFTLSDLMWPAAFGTLTGIVTEGGTVVGQVYGGGTLNAIHTNAGNYYIGIIAMPATGTTAPDDAGTYVLNVKTAPPAPTVNLTADESSVASGGTVHLIWTTTGASSCVASGGGWSGTFTGSQATSDSVTSPAITAATTFTLTCTGGGGTTAGTTSVSVQSAPAKGGGGALDYWALLALLALVTLDRRRETLH